MKPATKASAAAKPHRVMYHYTDPLGTKYKFGTVIDADNYGTARELLRQRMVVDGMPMGRIEFLSAMPTAASLKDLL